MKMKQEEEERKEKEKKEKIKREKDLRKQICLDRKARCKKGTQELFFFFIFLSLYLSS